jgi:citrate lyase subunit beta/citryl-CoA lyase
MKVSFRSLLFVSADDPDRAAKAGTRGADAIILDLEDAVPTERKPHARAALPALIDLLAGQGCSVVIRINSAWQDIVQDLAAAVRPGAVGLMVPKVESAARLSVIAEMTAEWATSSGLKRPPGLLALVESPAGLGALDEIAAVRGLLGLAVGSEDFSLSLAIPPSAEVLALPCRLLALAAARHGIMALGLPISIATIENSSAWEEAVRQGRAIGITGALCIHPRQVQIANAGLGPAKEEIEKAMRLLNAWEAAGGTGVIKFEGKMVDLPVARAAARLASYTLP